ncbi:hypothetical protein [Azospirillum agricola]|uniref:hypothetical protein n=1 Tax=Azospirillum agricola TaxID=1720247 RepID=UPI000A0F0D2B|nr:hypothetical protein [Azospirillum agricola]SMH62564.1 hypothetical protein SAMN02982994_6367 [Azospirillum lipoferum]
MNHPGTAVASKMDALAAQLDRLAETPSQQAPAQTNVLADRLIILADDAKQVDFRIGVRLAQQAEPVRGRAVARCYTPYSADELFRLAILLRALAAALRTAPTSRPAPAGQFGGGDAA